MEPWTKWWYTVANSDKENLQGTSYSWFHLGFGGGTCHVWDQLTLSQPCQVSGALPAPQKAKFVFQLPGGPSGLLAPKCVFSFFSFLGHDRDKDASVSSVSGLDWNHTYLGIFYNIFIYIYPMNFMKWTLNAGYSIHGSHVGLVLAAQPGWCPCSGCWSSSSGWVCSVAPPGLKHATCWNTARMDGFDLPTWSNLQLGISHLVFYNLIWLNIFLREKYELWSLALELLSHVGPTWLQQMPIYPQLHDLIALILSSVLPSCHTSKIIKQCGHGIQLPWSSPDASIFREMRWICLL